MTRLLPDTSQPPSSPAGCGYTARDDGFVCLDGVPLHLPPKERAVLHLLLQRWPDVVPKEEFAARIWRGQVMSDESLARCITQLRGSLAVPCGLAIRAVYGTGYRLVLVQVESDARPLEVAVEPRHAATLTHARQLIHQRTPAGLRRAEQLLRELVLQAPSFAAAKLALAECMASMVGCGMAAEREALQQSLLELASMEGRQPAPRGLHAEMAHLLDCQWRFGEASRLHQLATVTDEDGQAHYYLGWHLLSLGRAIEAGQSLRKAQELNPFSVRIGVLLARSLSACGEVDAGLRQACHVAETSPDSLAAQTYLLGYRAFMAPRPELADEADRIMLGPGSWAYAASTLAYVYARAGQAQRARELIRDGGDATGLRANAIGPLLCLGQADEAMACALAAAAQGCGQLPLLMEMPESATLKRHADFARLRQLVQGWAFDAQ